MGRAETDSNRAAVNAALERLRAALTADIPDMASVHVLAGDLRQLLEMVGPGIAPGPEAP